MLKKKKRNPWDNFSVGTGNPTNFNTSERSKCIQ